MTKSIYSKADALNASALASQRSKNNPVASCPMQTDKVGIIPLRYALEGSDKPTFGLPKEGQWKPPLTLKHSHYVLRQIRDGWLYVYSEIEGKLCVYKVKGDEYTEENSNGKPPLIFNIYDQVYLAYSHQPWSKKLIEKAEKKSAFRQKYMRSVSIFEYTENLSGLHYLDPEKLSKNVADFDHNAHQKEIADSLNQTITPLKKMDEPLKDTLGFIKEKPFGKETSYRVKYGSKPNHDAVGIVLDDPLADIHDLTLKLQHAYIRQQNIVSDLGKKEKHYRFQLGLITSQLAQITPIELPEDIKKKPAKLWGLTQAVNQYLALEPANELSTAAMAHQEPYEYANLQRQKEAFIHARSQLLNYGYPIDDITDEDRAQFSERGKYYDKVNWQELYPFMTQCYEALSQCDIEKPFDDLLRAVTNLGDDPSAFGIDIQTTEGQAYLNAFIAPVVQALLLAAKTEKQIKKLKETFEYGQNIIALTPFFYSKSAYDAFMARAQQWFQSTSPADPLSLANATAGWLGFMGSDKFKEWLTSKPEIAEALEAAQKACQVEHEETLAGLIRLSLDKEAPEGYLLRLSLYGKITKKTLNPNPEYQTQIEQSFQEITKLCQLRDQFITEMATEPTTMNQKRLGNIDDAIQSRVKAMPALIEDGPLVTAYKSAQLDNSGGQVAWGVLLVNMWNTAVFAATFWQQLKTSSAWMDKANVWATQISNIAWTLNAGAALALLPSQTQLSSIVVQDKFLLNYKFQQLKIDDISAQITDDMESAISEYVMIARFTIVFGLLASGTQIFSIGTQISSSSGPIKVFLWGEELAVISQFAEFGSQFLHILVGLEFMSELMPFFIFVSAAVYMISSLIINELTLNPLQEWLQSSTWGIAPNPMWLTDHKAELLNLEQIVDKVQVTQTVDNIEIYLPAYLKNQPIHLQVMQIPASDHHWVQDFKAAVSLPVYGLKKQRLNITQGQWQRGNGYIYRIPRTLNDDYLIAVAIEYNTQWTHSAVIYRGVGQYVGDIPMSLTNNDSFKYQQLIVGGE